MTKEEFISKVLVVLNEAASDEAIEQMIGADLTRVSVYIENLYPSAWRRAVKVLPLSWFGPTSFAGNTHKADAPGGTGYVVLPDDFLALYSFRMEGWKVPCLAAPESNEKIDRKQSKRYLRGTPQRPVCVTRLANVQEDGVFAVKKALYYYSLPRSGSESTHVVEEALYVANVTAMPDTLDIDGKLADPLAYICAGTVLASFEKNDLAKALDGKAMEMI
jgi:hypothetical protein